MATETMGRPLALEISPADGQDRDHVAGWSAKMHLATKNSVGKSFVDQRHTGMRAADAAEQHGIEWELVKVDGVKDGFILLPRRWVIERTNAWAARFRRLSRDYERLDQVLVGAHFMAYGMLLLHRLLPYLVDCQL